MKANLSITRSNNGSIRIELLRQATMDLMCKLGLTGEQLADALLSPHGVEVDAHTRLAIERAQPSKGISGGALLIIEDRQGATLVVTLSGQKLSEALTGLALVDVEVERQ